MAMVCRFRNKIGQSKLLPLLLHYDMIQNHKTFIYFTARKLNNNQNWQ